MVFIFHKKKKKILALISSLLQAYAFSSQERERQVPNIALPASAASLTEPKQGSLMSLSPALAHLSLPSSSTIKAYLKALLMDI